jgi:uncharacterized protein (DUF1015 family)
MAEIAGFKGLLFDPSRVEMDKVLAPPYDVIDDAGRQELAELDDKNCVRIILPEARGEADARYTHARQLLESWTEEGTLVQDAQPALYRYHQVFSRRELGDKPVTRRGFIAAVRLHDFDERVILRHERTLKGPKVDRLKLWESTRTHLSQIFTLYSDPTAAVDSLFSEAEESAPTIEGTTADGTKHLLWRVSDPAVLQAVSAAMDDKNLYIADGHHRYETMLALRDKLLAENPTAGPQSALRFGMMFLANIDDPGLVVLPTHRLVHSVAGFDATKLRERLREYFVLSEVAGGARDAIGLRAELAAAAQKGTSFALVMPGESVATILTLRSDVDLAAAGLAGSKETLSLDVTLLHGLVLEKILGIDRAAQEAQSSIHYVKHTQVALDRCAAGEGQACFLMNATPVSQIVAVSDADEVMPQKSTFFYPKIASGMVFNPIDLPDDL